MGRSILKCIADCTFGDKYNFKCNCFEIIENASVESKLGTVGTGYGTTEPIPLWNNDAKLVQREQPTARNNAASSKPATETNNVSSYSEVEG